MYFAEKHLEIAKETGDKSGEVTARMNLSDLRLVVGLKSNSGIPSNVFRNTNTNSSALPVSFQGYPSPQGVRSSARILGSAENLGLSPSPDKNQTRDPSAHPDWEVETFPGSSKNNTLRSSTKLFLHRLKSKKQKTPKSSPKDQDENRAEHSAPELDAAESPKPGSRDTIGEDGFFDLLSRFQGNRMDDQRCSLLDDLPAAPPSPSSTPPAAQRKPLLGSEAPSQDPAHFLELLASSQARRLDDQRVSLSHFPGLRLSSSNPPPTSADRPPPQAPTSCAESPRIPSPYSRLEAGAEPPEGDDVFFDMLVKCQGSRLNDQRCAAPPSQAKGPTVPDEDFLSLIQRSQSHRMEEQRVLPPPDVSQSKPD
ncbi:G-protein-signaling modulator 2 [Liparis tanakae]|uniref:G-protein-signaling modulator 2 n=1 Tax=Liparis tanakae TaxID=230148 RepID=A0A4Z2FBD9_9TELE|nr:G-protein-signaling modulator 2 [Liparis tanakae]